MYITTSIKFTFDLRSFYCETLYVRYHLTSTALAPNRRNNPTIEISPTIIIMQTWQFFIKLSQIAAV